MTSIDTKSSQQLLRDRHVVTMETRCAFCAARFQFKQHEEKKIKLRYYCHDKCKEDYSTMKDPGHPLYHEARTRYRRFTGRL